MIEPCVSNPVIVDLELVHSPDVGHLEYGLIDSIGLLLKCGTDEWVDANEFQLDVIGFERLPFAILQLVNLDFIHL